MNRALVDRIADAVLYEGYILYPYRPSVKNRQRWTFGGIHPEAYGRARNEAWSNQTECLVRGGRDAALDVVVRFLHLTARIVGAIDPPLAEWPADVEPPFRPVETLIVGGKRYQTWQEAEEREIPLDDLELREIPDRPYRRPFTFPARRRLEPLLGPGGVVGVLVREQQAVAGEIEVAAERAGEGLFRVAVRVVNRTPLENADSCGRDDALLRSLISAHTILGIRNGEFVSLLDPPENLGDAAAACRQVGLWPVLVGEEGRRDMMLASPIILYDYPQVAPESPGDFFDGAEIDEMLMLRIWTLTDGEKDAMAAVDERARDLLARIEGMKPEQVSRLHGALRDVRPL